VLLPGLAKVMVKPCVPRLPTASVVRLIARPSLVLHVVSPRPLCLRSFPILILGHGLCHPLRCVWLHKALCWDLASRLRQHTAFCCSTSWRRWWHGWRARPRRCPRRHKSPFAACHGRSWRRRRQGAEVRRRQGWWHSWQVFIRRAKAHHILPRDCACPDQVLHYRLGRCRVV